jgi:hypothetical protein
LTLKATFIRSFATRLNDGSGGICNQFLCNEPQTLDVPIDEFGKFNLDGKRRVNIDKFSIGALTGFEMALQSLCTSTPWFSGEFQRHDLVTITCTKITEPSQSGYSGMPEFEISVER